MDRFYISLANPVAYIYQIVTSGCVHIKGWTTRAASVLAVMGVGWSHKWDQTLDYCPNKNQSKSARVDKYPLLLTSSGPNAIQNVADDIAQYFISPAARHMP